MYKIENNEINNIINAMAAFGGNSVAGGMAARHEIPSPQLLIAAYWMGPKAEDIPRPSG